MACVVTRPSQTKAELYSATPTSAATVIAIELTWAMGLASRVASVGGVVLETVRIPAPVVNAVLDTIQEHA